MFKYSRIQVNRSETTTFAIDVAPWEVPIVAAVNGEDRVLVVGETPVKKPLPDAAVEFDRLIAKYKINTENGQTWAETVYGVGGRGVSALAAEIAKARQVASLPPVQTAEYDSKDDPLAGLFDDVPEAAGDVVEIAE